MGFDWPEGKRIQMAMGQKETIEQGTAGFVLVPFAILFLGYTLLTHNQITEPLSRDSVWRPLFCVFIRRASIQSPIFGVPKNFDRSKDHWSKNVANIPFS